MKNFLFLDLDGVLNPFKTASQPAFLKDSWEKIAIPGSSYRVWVNPALGSLLTEVCADLSIELVWATTWVDNPKNLEFYAARTALPSGLPRIRQVEEFLFDQNTCGKLPGVSSYMAAHPTGSMLWLDDNLGATDLAWVSSRATRSPSSAMRVDPSTGLSSQHFDAIASFFSRSS